MNYFLGTKWWEKIEVWFFRTFGCNHPDSMDIDLGDEDRGQDWYCAKCQRSYKEIYETTTQNKIQGF